MGWMWSVHFHFFPLGATEMPGWGSLKLVSGAQGEGARSPHASGSAMGLDLHSFPLWGVRLLGTL